MGELIDQTDIDDINADLADVAEFTEEPITYKQYTGITKGDQVEGTADTPDYVPDPTVPTAAVRDLTVEEIAVSGGRYEMGDLMIKVRRALKPDYKDRIECRGSEWEPKRISPPPLKGVLLWTVIARKA